MVTKHKHKGAIAVYKLYFQTFYMEHHNLFSCTFIMNLIAQSI